MKIYDCIIFFDETLLLDIRLNYLKGIVEKFIIVESKETHQGKKKKLNFDIRNYLKFQNKIIYLVINNFNVRKPWERENFQRNYLMNAFNIVSDEDYIMISDADEIPNHKTFKLLNNHKISLFEQKTYQYKFNLLNISDTPWYGSRAVKKKYLKSPQWLRKIKAKKYPFWRVDRPKFQIIKNGGWHFSYLKEPKDIRKKIISFAHAEYNKKKFRSLNYIKSCVASKSDLFDRNSKFKKIKLNKNFPDFVFKKKFKKWII